MASAKKGNVVLIEAFVVLCLLFVLQYVLAGISDSWSEAPQADFFTLTIEEVETADNTTNHLAYVQLNEYMVDMEGSDPKSSNCPPVPNDPRVYPFILGKTLEGIPHAVAGVSRVSDPRGLQRPQAGLAKLNLSVNSYRARVGRNLLLMGYLRDLSPNDLFVSVFTCECRLTPPSVSDLKYPHPVILTLTVFSGGSATQSEHIAYHHVKQEAEPGAAALYEDSAHMQPEQPLHRFDFRLHPSGVFEVANFESRLTRNAESPHILP
jgi:hypothetical protein